MPHNTEYRRLTDACTGLCNNRVMCQWEKGVFPEWFGNHQRRSTPMPQRTAMIGSLPEAFGMMKAMRADGPDWGAGCRRAVRRAAHRTHHSTERQTDPIHERQRRRDGGPPNYPTISNTAA